MVRAIVLAAAAACTAAPAVAQQIFDVVRSFPLICSVCPEDLIEVLVRQWSTTWDRSDLFTYTNLSPNPVNFVTPGAIGSADIIVNDGSVLQSMVGHGATLSTCEFSDVHPFMNVTRLSSGLVCTAPE